ncbi:MAG: hypothetical protein ABEJ36_02360 [Candidatus Nanosalina sp.]
MNPTTNGKTFKTAILLLAATLTLSTATAIDWNYPAESESPFGESVEMSFDASMHSNVGTVTVFFKRPGDNSFTSKASDATRQGSDSNFTETHTQSSKPYGEYEFKAVAYYDTNNTIIDNSTVRTFTLDGKTPSVERKGDEYIGENGEFAVRFKDSFTQVDSMGVYGGQINASRDVSCNADTWCTESFSFDTDDLSTGDDVSLTAWAVDAVGNNASGSISLEFDNQYEGDSTPVFSLEDADDSNNVMLDSSVSDKLLTATLEPTDAGETDIRVKCKRDGNVYTKTNFKDIEEGGTDFTCTVEGEKVAGDTVSLSVRACDRAGNCVETESRSYTFDAEAPTVESFETVEEYNVFNSDFDVEYSVSDEASGVAALEYYFDDSTDPGNGNAVSSSGDDNFTVDTSGLDRGQHTVYLRARDEVGHWSSEASLDFQFYPDTSPKVVIDAPERFNITAGKERTLDVTLRNPGKLFVENVKLTASSPVFSASEAISTLEADGGSQDVSFVVNTSSSEAGKYTLELETDRPRNSTTLVLLVEANQQQVQRIRNRLERFSNNLAALEQNISELRNDGLAKELNTTLASNVSDFRSKVQRVRNLVEIDKYYKAMSVMEGIESEYTAARSTYMEVRQQHRVNERNQLLLTAFGLILLISLGGTVYVLQSEEYEFDLGEMGFPEAGGYLQGVRKKLGDVAESLAEEEEEVEEEFRGFS